MYSFQFPERCEACELILSTNLSSVNNTIRVTKGEEVTFNVTFTHQDHNAFTFTVNDSITHPNFSCTSMKDTDVLTKTLLIEYRCVAMQLGTYLINSYVTFCNFDYNSPTVFTVIVENGKSSAYQVCMYYMLCCYSYFGCLINVCIRAVNFIIK